MALMNCPECSKPISDMADSCPSCGYVLTRKRGEGSAGNKTTLLVIGLCLGLFGAVVGVTVGNQFFGGVGAAGAVIAAVKLIKDAIGNQRTAG